MELEYFEKVDKLKGDLVMYYPTQDSCPVVILKEDIPWAVINTPPQNRAVITDLLDCLICSTCGNFIMNMRQTRENMEWRERFLVLQQRVMNGSMQPKVVRYVESN